MSDALSIVEFLTARLDEDEQVARDGAFCRGPEWAVSEEPPFVWGVDPPDPGIIARGKPIVRCDSEYGGGLAAPHIARHDPSRVLAEVAAKRALLAVLDGDPFDAMGAESAYLDLVRRHLSAVYSDHPDYQESWKP